MRSFLLAVPLFLGTATLVRADRMADHSPLMRAVLSDVAVIGEVTSLEKETVEAKAYPTAKEKTAFTIAVVKVETNIRGAKGITHIKVGYFPGSSGTGGTNKFPTLKAGQKVCLFLNKHPDDGFYIFPALAPPLEITDASKATVEQLKLAATIFENPDAALKAEKAEARETAACLLVVQYRSHNPTRTVVSEAVPLEQSQAILKILADADWARPDLDLGVSQAFMSLGLTEQPKFAKIQPKAGEDLKTLWQAELKRWLVEDGKGYRIQKFVPKVK
jgi:hypothetical protein